MLITCSRIQRLLTTLSKSAQEGDLKYGLVWILNGQKRLVCKWSGFRKVSEIRKLDHLKSGQKCPYFEWSGFQMVGTIAITKAKKG